MAASVAAAGVVAPSGDEGGMTTLVPGRKGRAAVAAFLDGVEAVLGGLRRGGGVELHREGASVRVSPGAGGVVVAWSSAEARASLVGTLTDLGREHGLFPQE